MGKNWLIRTKSNHILGPVSKEKVQELYKNASIKPDDEICSGNGFWFYVREEDMVERFLLGDESQGFNPISEAKDVLTLNMRNQDQEAEETSSQKDDMTVVGGISLAMLANEAPASDQGNSGEAPPVEIEDQIPPPAPQSEETSETKKKPRPEKVAKTAVPAPQPVKQKPSPAQPKKQNYLKWVGILGFLVLFGLIYFRKTIIKSLFDGEVSEISFSIINEVHAQEILPEKKNY